MSAFDCEVEGCHRPRYATGMCNTHYVNEWKRTTGLPIPHATYGGYTRGCRCALCTQAATDYHREYQRARAAQKRAAK